MTAEANTTGRLVGRKPSSARRFKAGLFQAVCIAATAFAILTLGILLFTLGSEGLGRVSWDFLNSYPSRFPDQAGIRSAFL